MLSPVRPRRDRRTAGKLVGERDRPFVRLAGALPHRNDARATWIAYPKGNRADINRDSIWKRAEELGWILNANVSPGGAWSAVRIEPQGADTSR